MDILPGICHEGSAVFDPQELTIGCEMDIVDFIDNNEDAHIVLGDCNSNEEEEEDCEEGGWMDRTMNEEEWRKVIKRWVEEYETYVHDLKQCEYRFFVAIVVIDCSVCLVLC